jgi:hypothetical protein
MYEGETLFDAFDATQSSGLLPGPGSWQFKALLRAADLAVTARKARRSAPVLRSRQR